MDKRHIEIFANVVMSLILVRDVNLARISRRISCKGTARSAYRKLQRFFLKANICMDQVALFLLLLMFPNGESLHLTIDRTNWKYGEHNLNLLVLGVVYQGAAIPLLWTQLDKQGNSNTAERIALMERCIKVLGQERIAGLLADREFIGKRWFEYLGEKNILYIIRVKENTLTFTTKGEEVSLKQLFQHLEREQNIVLRKPRSVWGHKLYLSAKRLSDGELLVVASPTYCFSALSVYGNRWEIEILFECLKGRGFNLENTRLTDDEKIEKMMAVCAIAFVWAHKVGEWVHENLEPIRIKSHGRPERRIFRLGLDYLADIIGGFNYADLWHIVLDLFRPNAQLPKNTGNI
jgi:hypothetical protein